MTELIPSTVNAPKSTSYLMRRLWRESISHYTKWIALAVFCMIIMSAANGGLPLIMQYIVDDVFVAKDKDMLWPVGFAVIATFFVKGMANYAQSLLMLINTN